MPAAIPPWMITATGPGVGQVGDECLQLCPPCRDDSPPGHESPGLWWPRAAVENSGDAQV